MATAAARAVQRAQALDRLNKAAKKLAKAYGVDAPDIPTAHRDPAYVPTLQMEAMADFLESLAKAPADDAPDNGDSEVEPKTAPKRKAKAG